MRQYGDYRDDKPLTSNRIQHLLQKAVDDLDVEQARREVAPFIKDRSALEVFLQDFFRQLIPRINAV